MRSRCAQLGAKRLRNGSAWIYFGNANLNIPEHPELSIHYPKCWWRQSSFQRSWHYGATYSEYEMVANPDSRQFAFFLHDCLLPTVHASTLMGMNTPNGWYNSTLHLRSATSSHSKKFSTYILKIDNECLKTLSECSRTRRYLKNTAPGPGRFMG